MLWFTHIIDGNVPWCHMFKKMNNETLIPDLKMGITLVILDAVGSTCPCKIAANSSCIHQV